MAGGSTNPFEGRSDNKYVHESEIVVETPFIHQAINLV